MNRGGVFGRAHRELSKFAFFLQNSSEHVADFRRSVASRARAAAIPSASDWKVAFPTCVALGHRPGPAGPDPCDPRHCPRAAVAPAPDHRPTPPATRTAKPKESCRSHACGQEHQCSPHGSGLCGRCCTDRSPPQQPRQQLFCLRGALRPGGYSERRYAIKSAVSVAEGANSLKKRTLCSTTACKVAALPSCRYGAVSNRPFRLGVSNKQASRGPPS